MPLLLEPRECGGSAIVAARELDGDTLRETAIDSFRQPDVTHTSATEASRESECTNAGALDGSCHHVRVPVESERGFERGVVTLGCAQ